MDVLKNRHCCQFALLPVFVEKVEVYGKTISSYSFQDIGMRFLHSTHNYIVYEKLEQIFEILPQKFFYSPA